MLEDRSPVTVARPRRTFTGFLVPAAAAPVRSRRLLAPWPDVVNQGGAPSTRRRPARKAGLRRRGARSSGVGAAPPAGPAWSSAWTVAVRRSGARGPDGEQGFGLAGVGAGADLAPEVERGAELRAGALGRAGGQQAPAGLQAGVGLVGAGADAGVDLRGAGRARSVSSGSSRPAARANRRAHWSIFAFRADRPVPLCLGRGEMTILSMDIPSMDLLSKGPTG